MSPSTMAPARAAAAFARANHPALQTILRVDRQTDCIWLGVVRGSTAAGALTDAQLGSLREALEALHAAGVSHGHVDAEHVVVEEDGAAVLRFAASCDGAATAEGDRLALALLGGGSA